MLRDFLVSFAGLVSALLLVETASAQVASTSASLAKSTRAGQTITVDGIAEFRQGDTLVVSGYTFVISADGRTATENGSGQISYVGGGATVICTFTGTASYQKIGN